MPDVELASGVYEKSMPIQILKLDGRKLVERRTPEA